VIVLKYFIKKFLIDRDFAWVAPQHGAGIASSSGSEQRSQQNGSDTARRGKLFAQMRSSLVTATLA